MRIGIPQQPSRKQGMLRAVEGQLRRRGERKEIGLFKPLTVCYIAEGEIWMWGVPFFSFSPQLSTGLFRTKLIFFDRRDNG